ncbi:hypothetical protein [Chryseobacterium terrae]|uniref:Natural product n=1 Tax=Chryseobacterium terrae TaxID=3163299 RepID=A0ABW8Y6K9_9FLAO
MKNLKTIKQFEQEQKMKKEQMENVFGADGPLPPSFEIGDGDGGEWTNERTTGKTGPYPPTGQCDSVTKRDGDIIGGTGTGPGLC